MLCFQISLFFIVLINRMLIFKMYSIELFINICFIFNWNYFTNFHNTFLMFFLLYFPQFRQRQFSLILHFPQITFILFSNIHKHIFSLVLKFDYLVVIVSSWKFHLLLLVNVIIDAIKLYFWNLKFLRVIITSWHCFRDVMKICLIWCSILHIIILNPSMINHKVFIIA